MNYKPLISVRGFFVLRKKKKEEKGELRESQAKRKTKGVSKGENSE